MACCSVNIKQWNKTPRKAVLKILEHVGQNKQNKNKSDLLYLSCGSGFTVQQISVLMVCCFKCFPNA